MDKTLELLVSFTQSVSLADLTPVTRTRASEVLFDTIGCAVLGSDSEPAAIAARIANRGPAEPSATVFGYGIKSSPENAALANTMMVRYYDYNDAYPGHPSDMIAGVLAAAEVAHKSGIEVLGAIALAYDVVGGFGAGMPRGSGGYRGGFDSPFFGLGVALAAGKLWGLTNDQLANAASLAMVSNLSLSEVRWGELSMMTGCATAFSTRSGVFAAMLAKDGFTAPPEPFEGLRGFYKMTGQYEPRLPVFADGKRIIDLAVIKPLPAANQTIPPLELMLRNRDWAPLDEIESIEIEVPEEYDVHVASEHKYDPRDRKTADHSLPYMVARALTDGEITLDSAAPEKATDPAIRPLMRKVRVLGSQQMSEMSRSRKPEDGQILPVRVKIRTTTGKELVEQLTDHSGSAGRNPPRAFFDAKFDRLARGLSIEKREQIRDAWWNVEKVADIADSIGTLSGIREL